MLDPQLSLFDIANRWTVRRLFANYRGALKNISYQIEEAVLDGGVHTRIFAGFQKFSYFLPRVESYRELARVANGIWIIGEADASPPHIPGLTYVPISADHRLIEEWFLVVDSPEYFSALVAQDLSGFEVANHRRRFRGIWTFDDGLVHRLQVVLSEALGEQPLREDPNRPRDYHRQLQQLSLSTGKLVDMLERRNQALSRANQLREDLNHMLVHDMRNSLTDIIMTLNFLQMRMESLEPEEQKLMLQWAMDSGRVLNGMVGDLLDVARLEDGQMQLSREKLIVDELLTDAISLLKPAADQQNKRITLTLGDDLKPILGEKEKLIRVVSNLLSNAIKYAEEKIQVSVEVEACKVIFAIQDDGAGISAEAQARIFEKFQQAGGEQQRQGTGLGLAFCRLMVEAHGGQIWIESEEGQGSTFYFSIPVAEE